MAAINSVANQRPAICVNDQYQWRINGNHLAAMAENIISIIKAMTEKLLVMTCGNNRERKL